MYAVENKVIQMVAVALAFQSSPRISISAICWAVHSEAKMSASERPFQNDINSFDGVYDMAPVHDPKQLASNDEPWGIAKAEAGQSTLRYGVALTIPRNAWGSRNACKQVAAVMLPKVTLRR